MSRPGRLVLLFYGLKIPYLLLALGLDRFVRPVPFRFGDVNPKNELSVWFLFGHADTLWYKLIATTGYPPMPPEQFAHEKSVFAFWPLYPGSLRGLMYLAGWPFEWAALVVSLVVPPVALVLLYRLVKAQGFSEERAFWTVVLLLIFPYSFYYSAFYTEAYFLLLLVGSFRAIQRRQWGCLAVSGAALAVCRANGFVMALPLALGVLERTGVLDGWQLRLKGLRFGQLLPLVSLVSMVLALASYLWFLHQRTGDYLAFRTAQAAWGRAVTGSGAVQAGFLANFRVVTYALSALYGLLVVGVALAGLRRLPLSWQAVVWITLLLPLTTASTASLPRYLSVAFPLFVGFAGMFPEPGRRRNGVLLVLFALHLATFSLWVYGHHASF